MVFFLLFFAYKQEKDMEQVAMIKLISDQLQASQGKYISYTYEIPLQKPLQLFQRTSAYQGQRSFWQTNDGELTMIGLLPLKRLFNCDFEKIQNFQAEFKAKWLNLTPEGGLSPRLLGGFAFNLADQSTTEWYRLENGYFMLPQLLFLLSPKKAQVVLTTIADANLEAQLQNLQKQVERILEDAPITEPTQPITGEELAVTKWLNLVERSITEIKAGKMKKVVLARRLKVTGEKAFNSAVILGRLMKQQTNTYHFLLEDGDTFFIGATPERLVRATKDQFVTASVAGSIGRGQTPVEDDQLGNQLLNDAKNQLEHQIVVDRIKQSLAPFVENVIVGPAQLLKNHDIQHIYHPIMGKRLANQPLLTVVKALHPTPALGGEPRSKALPWLATEEDAGRGMYGGPIGWLDLIRDEGEFAVGLRSGVFSQNTGYLYAGCGIVADSIPEKERVETRLKFQPMLRGICDQWILK